MPIIQFKGKTAVESYHRVVPHHTLEIDGKLSLAKRLSLNGNLIIEGDNLIALKSLLPTHAGKIKCIYIDPPYNTGNEGWIYNDNLTQPLFKTWFGQTVGKEGEDACRHDKWCCMMYPRLQLLKELLRDDGAIFVSIDDNEVHHLRMLMDEVFGEENFAAVFSVINNLKGHNDKANVATCHEHLVVYSRNASFLANGLPLTAEQKEQFNLKDEKGQKYDLRDLRKRGRPDRREDRPNMWFPIFYNPVNESFALERKGKDDIEITPKRGDGSDGRWRWGKERVSNNLGILHAKFTSRSEKWDISHRVYMHQVSTTHILGDDDLDEDEETPEERTSKAKSIIMGGEFSTDVARRTVKQILGQDIFEYPKPVDLIRRIVQFAGDRDSIILDSFAGSGTTAHAVLELNKEDGGNRKFILVQQPFDTKENENDKFNICAKITRERVLRVSKGYSYKTQAGKTEKVEGLGGEFAYVRVGEKLMGEYRNLGDKLPDYEQVARYVYFTETSQNFDTSKMNKATGKIGEWQGTSFYLLYSPDKKEARALDVEFLEKLKDKNLRKVIYCEKVWVHREDLSKFGDVRPMLVPFNLK